MPLNRLLVPLAAFAALYFALNTGLVAVAVASKQDASIAAIWRRYFAPLWLTHFSGATVAALIVLIYSLRADLFVLALVAPIPLILYATFSNSVGRVEDHLAHLGTVNRMYLATIETLAQAIDAKDHVTHGHIRRVQRYAMRLARALGIEDERELLAIEAASLLHDMGKLGVPEHILNKPGKLTAVEFEKMKRHVVIGADMLSTIDFPYPVVPIVRCHHENWNGTGYPLGLKGDAIPIGARILSVVDCFDALTSDRPYRRKVNAVQALRVLEEHSGTKYDPRVVARFVELCSADAIEHASAVEAPFAPVVYIPQALPAHEGVADSAADSAIFDAAFDLAVAIDSASDLHSIVRAVHSVASQRMGASCTAIHRHDAETDLLIAEYVCGQHAEAIRGRSIPFGERVTGWVAAHRSPVINADAALDHVDSPAAVNPGPRVCLSAPLEDKGELVGVLTIYSDHLSFSDGDAQLVDWIARRIAAAARSGRTKPAVTRPVSERPAAVLRFAR